MQGVKKRTNYLISFCKFYIKSNWQIVFFAVLYLLGLLCGVFLIKVSSDETLRSLYAITTGFMKSRNSWDTAAVFLFSFGSNAVFLVFLFFCGFCAVGYPFIIAAALLKGAGAGITAGYLYLANGTAAIPYVCLAIMPMTVLNALVFIWGAKFAYQMSRDFSKSLRGSDEGRTLRIPAYCIFYLILFLLTCLIAWLDSAVGLYFSHRINL